MIGCFRAAPNSGPTSKSLPGPQFSFGLDLVRSHKVSGCEIYIYRIVRLLRDACQISKWCDNLNCQSCDGKTSRDVVIRCLVGYWNRAQLKARLKHRKNFWALTGLRRDFGLILLILIHMIFICPTHLLSANVWGFAVSADWVFGPSSESKVSYEFGTTQPWKWGCKMTVTELENSPSKWPFWFSLQYMYA